MSDYISVYCQAGQAYKTFLIDTQADCSVIKQNSLDDTTIINHSNIIKITGVTSGSLFSLGTINTNIILNSAKLYIIFHVVPHFFDIPVDGILGKDFLNNYSCVIDYSQRLLTVNVSPTNGKMVIPILETSGTIRQLSSTPRSKILEETLRPTFPLHAPNSLEKLCSNYSDVFHLPGDVHTVNNFYKQDLRLSDPTPIYCKNYRSPHALKDEISNQVQQLLSEKIIEPCNSPFNSPIILVPKKSPDGSKKYRLCVDFRKLNQRLCPDKFPIPRIDDVLDNLGRAQYFSTIDLHSGFHQIPLTENSKNLTAFSTPEGSFRYNVLPFGLNVAPNSFARMMSLAFGGLPPATAFIYLDDIIVVGESIEHHIQNLETIFKICRSKCLKINPNKCKFLQSEVTFLGHRVTIGVFCPIVLNSMLLETIQFQKTKRLQNDLFFSATIIESLFQILHRLHLLYIILIRKMFLLSGKQRVNLPLLN